jgi:hypothetical protein
MGMIQDPAGKFLSSAIADVLTRAAARKTIHEMRSRRFITASTTTALLG